MIARWRWTLTQLSKKLWLRAALFSLLGVATALASILFKDAIPWSLSARVGADAVDKILSIIASSMLAVTTFSLSTMMSAYSSASNGVTPRATILVIEDTTTQNVLATFIGSFLFSLVGLIALSAGAYGAQGRVLLFAVTIMVVILIVWTLLRWINYLAKLGRNGDTIDQVEQAAVEAIEHRVEWPYLGGSEYPVDWTVPSDARTVASDTTGYVQHIDVSKLSALAEQAQVHLYVTVLPGSFVHLSMPVVHIVAPDGQSGPASQLDPDEISACLTIGAHRTFAQDPRFGLAVLAEIASRALSSGGSDPGTAIDVVGRGVRTLTTWVLPREDGQAAPRCERVFLKGLDMDDQFEDFFLPIGRDGAGILEVNVRLLKALTSLTQVDPQRFGAAAARQARLIHQRAEKKLELEEERARVRALALGLERAGG